MIKFFQDPPEGSILKGCSCRAKDDGRPDNGTGLKFRSIVDKWFEVLNLRTTDALLKDHWMNTEGLLDDNERSISGKSVSIWGNFWGFQRFVGKYRTFWDLSILFKSLGKISKKINIGKQMTFRWPPLPWVGLICLICLFTTEVSCSLREPHWLPEWVILHLTSIMIGKSYLGENHLKNQYP